MRRTTPGALVKALVTVGLSSALCATFTAPALAQSEQRQVVVEEQLGSATPLGVVGVAVDAEVLPWLSISAGIGTDILDRDDAYDCQCQWTFRQLALMPRLRRPIFDGATFVAVGVGVSRNAQPDVGGLHSPLVRQDDEVAVERRFDSGVRVRAFAGIGFSVGEAHLPPFAGSFYYGAALGYAVAPNPDRSSLPPAGWYGWQPLLSDMLAGSVGIMGSRNHQAVRAAAAIYAVPAPLIHVANHRYGHAAASAAVRCLLPLLFWKTFTSPNPDGGYDIEPTSAALTGAVIAALVDDLLLSWK